MVALLSCVGLAYTEAFAEDALQKYAQQCDQTIGITVPGFNCDEEPKFTLVPTTDHGMPSNATFTGGEPCDRPNVLNQRCDPGSHFWVIRDPSKPEAFAVAHCRKHDLPDGFMEISPSSSTTRKMAPPASTKR
jgi:hypothetical protein